MVYVFFYFSVSHGNQFMKSVLGWPSVFRQPQVSILLEHFSCQAPGKNQCCSKLQMSPMIAGVSALAKFSTTVWKSVCTWQIHKRIVTKLQTIVWFENGSRLVLVVLFVKQNIYHSWMVLTQMAICFYVLTGCINLIKQDSSSWFGQTSLSNIYEKDIVFTKTPPYW